MKQDDTTMQMILGLIRHVLTTAGGAYLADGVMDADTLQTVVAAITTLIGFGWSMAAKRRGY